MSFKATCCCLLLAVALAACLAPPPTATAPPSPAATLPSPTPRRSPTAVPSWRDVVDALDLDSLLGYVQALTQIQPYSGWRNSATSGELEAVEYAQGVLDSLTGLTEMGMTTEVEEFNVFMATEVWETRLSVTVEGQEYQIPVSATTRA
jgi:hypothetical protein